MEDSTHVDKSSRRMAALKALILVVFLIGAFIVMRFTPAKEWLTPDQLGHFLDAAGFWAPLLYIVIYAIGICAFVPGTLLTAVGAALFGPYRGFAYVWIGAMAGATGAFFIGRTLGRDFAASLVGKKLEKYDDAIERNGFATVLYLRLIYFPFTLMNFGMGLTKVRFRGYFLGTALGIVVGTFVFTFLIGNLRDIWMSGNWSGLLSWKIGVSVALFAFSFSIPVIVKKARRKMGLERPHGY